MRTGAKHRSQRGQAVVELAFQIPLIMLLLFGSVQIARVFYVYHTLQKAMRGGAGLLARSVNVAYCDQDDAMLVAARNFVVYGNLQGEGAPIVPGLTPDMIQILPEREMADSTGVTGVTSCLCAEESAESCNSRAPDFVVVNLRDGFPLLLSFPFVNVGTVTLRASVRMPVTGG